MFSNSKNSELKLQKIKKYLKKFKLDILNEYCYNS